MARSIIQPKAAALAFSMLARLALGALVAALLAFAPFAWADPDPANATPGAILATAQSCVGVDPGPPPSLVGTCYASALDFGAEVILPAEAVVTLGVCYNVDYGPPPVVWTGPCEDALLNLTSEAGLP